MVICHQILSSITEDAIIKELNGIVTSKDQFNWCWVLIFVSVFIVKVKGQNRFKVPYQAFWFIQVQIVVCLTGIPVITWNTGHKFVKYFVFNWILFLYYNDIQIQAVQLTYFTVVKWILVNLQEQLSVTIIEVLIFWTKETILRKSVDIPYTNSFYYRYLFRAGN